MTTYPFTSEHYTTDGSYGYTYTGNDDTVTIAVGVVVGAALADAIISDSTHHNDTLINSGIVLSGYDDAIVFDSDFAVINNEADAQIVGKDDGIRLSGDDSTVSNYGSVTALKGIGVYLGGAGAELDNFGTITGFSSGVRPYAGYGDGGTINNLAAGLIQSNHTGIDIYTAPTLTTLIVNGANATIRGTDYAIHTSQAGRISLTNDGKLIGNVTCDAPNENDFVLNAGSISGNVSLGTGSDIYKGVGTVTGSIQGGGGTDTFYAGKAREVFWGNAGQDKFVFNATVFSPAGATRDIIQDFKHAEADKIDVHLIDADLTLAGNQAFRLIGTDTFAHYHATHASVVGMLRFDPATDQLQGNVNADFGNAEFSVTLHDVAAVFGSDFVL